ncbi:MAG: hypothetical protein ACI4EF_02150, partial [Coprococcus sp.]
MEAISLLWKNKPQKIKHLPANVLDDFGISYLVENVFFKEEQQKFAMEKMSEICTDGENILYRQDIWKDLYEKPDFAHEMSLVLEEIKKLDIVQKSYVSIDKKSGLLQLIDRLRELKLYIEVVLALHETLGKTKLVSEGFLKMKKIVDEISNNKGFAELREDIREIMENMSLYQSITIGLNLDSMMNVDEVLLLSVNPFRHKKNVPILKRFGQFLQGAAATGSNIEQGVIFTGRNTRQKDPLMENLEHLLSNDLEGLTKKLWQMLQKYVDLSGSALTRIIPELEFYLGFVRFYQKIEAKGLPICLPEIVEKATQELSIKDCYNIKLFLKAEENGIVTNDFQLDKQGNIYILTGPNSGGKTTYTQAVGCAILLAQQGLAVPAQFYRGTMFDGIYTHFPATEENTVCFGRLGEEAKRIKEIMSEATNRSIVFFNETYSSTSFSEGLFLAKDLVSALKYRNIATIYNTHMHELASEIEALNKEPGEGKVDSL